MFLIQPIHFLKFLGEPEDVPNSANIFLNLAEPEDVLNSAHTFS